MFEIDDDQRLVAALRHGDERAFTALVERYGALTLRVASTDCRTPAVAEEVVQETWLAVLEGIGRFEGWTGSRDDASVGRVLDVGESSTSVANELRTSCAPRSSTSTPTSPPG